MFDKAGRFNGYRGVARDITERKRASEALREAQMQLAHANRVATMGQLTASIAHEVNQPIAADDLERRDGVALARRSSRRIWTRRGKRSATL